MNRAAFLEFYDVEYEPLVAAVSFISGDIDFARDVVDEAVARAWERSSRGYEIESLGAWTRVVALNITRDRYRRLRVERRAEQLADLTERDTADVSAAIDVQRALARLPLRQREVTVLRYYLDLSIAEIAEELDIAAGTVKATLHSARAVLARILAERQPVEPKPPTQPSPKVPHVV